MGAAPARQRVDPLPEMAWPPQFLCPLAVRVLCRSASFVLSDKKASRGFVMASLHDSNCKVLDSMDLLVANTLGDRGKGLVDEHVRSWILDCF